MTPTSYHFGEFLLDPAKRELHRSRQLVPVRLKVLSCITYLIENRDRAVGRDELISAVWGNVFLTDSVLGQVIRQARQALGDSGDDQTYIKTVRGFGYRWIAQIGSPDPSAHPSKHTMPDGEVALLLPVVLETSGDHSWVRLGIMDFIAQRLRGSGQPMVPSDAAIALTLGFPVVPRQEDVKKLLGASGAQFVIGARAHLFGTRWRISLRSLFDRSPPLIAMGEAHEVMEAARIAADRMAVALGLTPATEHEADPDLARFLHKTEAAMLAQQMGAARELIRSSPGPLQEQPEVRLQLGWIEYHSHHLDTAQSIFEAVLTERPDDHFLRARALHGLGGVHFRRGEHRRAKVILQEALRLFPEDAPLATRGRAERLLGFVTLIGGEMDVAAIHLAQARRAFEGAGDVHGLSALDNNLGVKALLEDSASEALFHFEHAVARQAALNDVDAELRNHANAVDAHLGLLDPQAALARDARICDLLSQTTNARTIVHAKLARSLLLEANGHLQEAEKLLGQVLKVVNETDMPLLRTRATAVRAERLLRAGQMRRAHDVSREFLATVSADYEARQEEGIAILRLVLIRSKLALQDLDGASIEVDAMNAFVRHAACSAPTVLATLASAELSVSRGEEQRALLAFRDALSLAKRAYMPLRVLQVVERFVPHLLEQQEGGELGSALALVDLISPYAYWDFGAALVQLHAYQVAGPRPAWRTALDRANSLAGERGIPAPLLTPFDTAMRLH